MPRLPNAVAAALLLPASLTAGGPRAQTPAGLPMPCLQVLGPADVRALVPRQLEVVSVQAVAGETTCAWWDEDGPRTTQPFTLTFVDRRAFFDKRLYANAVPTAADIYRSTVANFAAAGNPGELIGELGVRARAFDLEPGLLLFVLRPDGMLRITSTLPRDQVLALARRAAAARPPRLGRHVQFPGPAAARPAMPMTPGPETEGLPCVQMLTEAEVRSAKRQEILVDASSNRPGFSFCVWRSTGAVDTGFSLSVMTSEEFARLRMSGAAAYLSAQRKALASLFPVEPLYGVGNDAIRGDGSPPAVVMVRSGDIVATITCLDCSWIDTILLARLAVVVK